jgi:hypothetical protein
MDISRYTFPKSVSGITGRVTAIAVEAAGLDAAALEALAEVALDEAVLEALADPVCELAHPANANDATRAIAAIHAKVLLPVMTIFPFQLTSIHSLVYTSERV